VFSKGELTRRMLFQRFGIGSVCLAVLAKHGHAAAPARFDGQPELRIAVDLVRIALPHCRNAARVGSVYLGTAPEEYDLHCLLDAVAIPKSDVEAAVKSGNPEPLRSKVRRNIISDFASGYIAEVDGWIMSLTELRLAALVHMVQDLTSNTALS